MHWRTLAAPALILPRLLLGGLLLTHDFETEEDYGDKPRRFYREVTTEDSITTVSSPVRAGKQALKVHFRASDWRMPEPKRVEIYNVGAWGGDGGMALGQDWWFGFSEYIPEDWQPDDPKNPEIIWQFHGWEGGPASNNPPLAASIVEDKLVITLAEGSAPAASATSYRQLATLPLPKGKWLDVVLKVNFEYKKGAVQMWLNGQQIIDYSGPTLYPMLGQTNEKGPGFKLGIYKWDWGNQPTRVQERTLYIDEIRFGDSHSSYEEVRPR